MIFILCHSFIQKMAELTGLEPATSGVTDRRELQLHHSSMFGCTQEYFHSIKENLVAGAGFEPATFGL
jgi:hypothetical protein